MGSVDTALAAKEERKAKRTELGNARRKRAKDQWAQASASAVLDEEDSISEEENIDDEFGETVAHKFCTPPKKKNKSNEKSNNTSASCCIRSHQNERQESHFRHC